MHVVYITVTQYGVTGEDRNADYYLYNVYETQNDAKLLTHVPYVLYQNATML